MAQNNRLKIDLDDYGETYIYGSLRAQFWTRYMDMNPGTTINGEAVENELDISIRRIRLNIAIQLTPELFIYSLVGGNNINVSTEKKFTFNMLDLNAEYTFHKSIAIGIGENAWDGLSRWTTRSSGTLMALDAPLFSLLTVNKNDDVARGLGIWMKGQINKFDYVLSLKNPASYGVNPVDNKTDFALNRPRKRVSGYVKYEFWDDESNKTAYSGGTGSYLGEKSILNLGFGFMGQNSMTSRLVHGKEKFYDFKNWAIEVFIDRPTTDKSSSLTTYIGYFKTDFGPNYIRNVGANDYTSGGQTFNGSGNDFPMMGTGSTFFFQFGYAFDVNYSSFKIQPNIAIQHSLFDALDEPMIVYDVGINYYLSGQTNKITFGFQSRPIYIENIFGKIKISDYKPQLVLQYQVTIK